MRDATRLIFFLPHDPWRLARRFITQYRKVQAVKEAQAAAAESARRAAADAHAKKSE